MAPRAPLLLVAVVAAGAAVFACRGPSWVDKECIKGRLSAEQAEAISDGPWGHLPHYNRDAQGHCADCPAAEDRIFAARCSEFLKEVTLHE